MPSLSLAERRKIAERSVEALNHALRGIPAEKIRFHTCYGINEGPRVNDASLKDIVDLILKVNAGAYSFEAANPRHEHEYHVWETVKLPAGQGDHPRRDHACEQHRRAPGINRRAHHPIRQTGGSGKRHCRFGLRFFFSSHVQPGGSSNCRVGQVPSDGGRRAPGNETTLALIKLCSLGFFPDT